MCKTVDGSNGMPTLTGGVEIALLSEESAAVEAELPLEFRSGLAARAPDGSGMNSPHNSTLVK